MTAKPLYQCQEMGKNITACSVIALPCNSLCTEMSEKVFGVTTEIRAIRKKGVNQGSL